MSYSELANVYQIKVTLNSIHPPIWRRILVSDNINLLDLHNSIQDVFGWLDYHLHEFNIRNVHYGDPTNDEDNEFDIKDEVKFKLRKLNLTEGSRFTYEYDFGDSWEHILLVEKILPFTKGMILPQCITGKRSRPPEDVGGPWGYESFLEAIRDPQNEEHESYLEWAGKDFNPEKFDLKAINERLHLRRERN
ncbi:MAG: plasmid pRiA4b ORF-3 family protein [Leptolinea sp.]